MRKILLLVLCAMLPVFGQLTLRTWNGGSSDLNEPTNWTGGAGALSATDSGLMNATSGAATASAAPSLGYILTTSGYSGALSFSGYVLTVVSGAVFDHTGALNLGNGLTMTGSGTFHIGTGVSALTATNAVITLGDASSDVITFDDDEQFNPAKSLTVNGVVTVAGNGESRFFTTTLPLTLGADATMTVNKRINFAVTQNAGVMHSLGTGYTINGNNALYFYSYTTGTTVEIPATTVGGTVYLYLIPYLGPNNTVFSITGKIKTVNELSLISGSGATGTTFNLPTDSIISTSAGFVVGSSNGSMTLNCGAAIVTACSLKVNSVGGTTALNFQTSTHNYTGNVNYGSSWTNDGGTTATLNFTGANDAKFVTAGKNSPNIHINKTGTGKITATGNIPALSFGLDDGKFDAGTGNIVTSGNQTYSADTLFASTDTFRITGDATFRIDTTLGTGWTDAHTINTRTAATNFDSTHLDLQGNDSVIIRKFSLFKSAHLAYPNKTVKMTGNMEYPHALNIQDGKLILDSLGTLIHSNRIFLRSFTQGNKFDIGGADLTQSTGEIYYQCWNGLKDTIPAINMPLGALAITGRQEDAIDSVWITGSLSATYIAIRNDGTKIIVINFGPHTYTFPSKTDGLTINGNDGVLTPVKCNFGSGMYDLGYFGGTPSVPNNKAQVFNYQTAQFTVSGNIRVQPNTATDSGGVWIIDSAAYIKSSGTTFGDMTINAAAGLKILDSGALNVGDLTITSGKFHAVSPVACVDFTANNTGVGDTIIVDTTITLSGVFSCAADVIFKYGANGKIIMPDCTLGTTNGNTTVVLTYPAGCGATGGGHSRAKLMYMIY